MTNEEAKKAEKELNALLNMCNPSPLTKELEDALKMAIKALDQTDKIEESNFSTEQYKADLQGAYDCGYNCGYADAMNDIAESEEEE